MGRIHDAIYSVPPSNANGEPCKVGLYLRDLPPEDADDLKAALDSDVSAARISLSMSQNGAPLSASLISSHRGRLCRCYRKALTND